MKKSTKLLAILLAFVLVVGTLSIGALAASNFGHDYAQDAAAPVDGESIRTHINFDSLETKEFPAANTITSNPGSFKSDNGKTVALYYQSKSGKPAIVEAGKGAFNKYLSIDMSTQYGTSYGGYLSLSHDGYIGNSTQLQGGKTLDTVKYHVLDFDFYSPNGYATSSSYFGAEFQVRVLNAAGTAVANISDAGYKNNGIGLNINGSNGLYNNYPLGWVNKQKMDNSDWSHITFILETSVNDAGTPDNTADDYIDFRTYNVINGKVVGTYLFQDGNNSSGKFTQVVPDGTKAKNCYQADMTKLFINEIRFSFGNAKDGVVTQLDNIAVRSYSNEYDDTKLASILAQGVGADLTEWDRCAYDPAMMPMGSKVGATLNGVEYANLAAAVKAAKAGDEVVALADSSVEIHVDKAITIDTNGKNITNLYTAEGYAKSEEDGIITISKATKYLTVYWYECECGEGCIEEIETKVYTGNNIYDSYKVATGKDPVCKGTQEGLSFTTHTGFEDISGTLDAFDETTIAAVDLEGETIELAPTYKSDKVIAVRIDGDGNETYILESQGLTTASCNFNAQHITIKLLDNVVFAKDEAIKFNWSYATLDLNGYYITACKEGENADRITMFNVTGNHFTVMSSRVGGAIYNATKIGSYYKGEPIISAGTNGNTVNIIGRNDKGETTVSFYGATLYQSYSAAANLNVDGGRFVGGGAADGEGLFYLRHAGTTYNIKNAYFDGGYAVFSFAGLNKPTSTIVNIENCVFGTTAAVSTRCFAGLEITFDNCYIGNSLITKGVMSGATAPESNSATHILKNCYLKSGITANAVYAEGQTAYSVNMTKEFKVPKPTWSAVYAATPSYALTDSTMVLSIDKMIADEDIKPVQTLWYAADGETLLAESTAMPGGTASAPVIREVEGTNGMVVETYTDWNEDLSIKLGTTGPVKFTLKEGAEPVRVAGKINVMFNFDMTNHFTFNHYVPTAPEGITYLSVKAGGNKFSVPAANYTDPETGISYSKIESWPGIVSASTDYGFEITFTFDGDEYTFQAPNVSIPKYARYIISNDKYCAELKTAMADLTRAMQVSLVAAGKTPDMYLNKACEDLAPYMSDTSSAIDKTATNDLSAVSEYVNGVYFESIGQSNAPNFRVNVKDGYAAIFVGFNFYGYGTAGETRRIDNNYYSHNNRSASMNEKFTVNIYKVEDIENVRQTVYRAKEGATPVATFTITASGVANADTTASTATVNFYAGYLAYAKSAQAYMEWRRVNLGGHAK